MTRVEWAMNMAQDEHFKAVMQELRDAEHKKFAASAPLDIDTREDAYTRIRVFDDSHAAPVFRFSFEHFHISAEFRTCQG